MLRSRSFSGWEDDACLQKKKQDPRPRANQKGSPMGLRVTRPLPSGTRPLAQLPGPLPGLTCLADWICWENNPPLSSFLGTSPDNLHSREKL